MRAVVDVRYTRRTLAVLASLVAGPFALPATARAEGWWAQATRAVPFWSGPDAAATSFGELTRGTYVQVADPQPAPAGGRFFVQEASGQATGYVEAAALAPSGPPDRPEMASVRASPIPLPTPEPTPAPDGAPADGQEAAASAPPPAAVPAYRPAWVTAFRASELWSAMTGGTSFGRIAPGDAFLVMRPQDGPRLHVLNPRTKGYAFVDAAAVGPTGPPKAAAIEVKGWQGTVVADVVNLRTEPHTFIGAAGQVRSGDQVTVAAWLEGEELDPDNRTWARVTAVRRRDGAGAWQDVALGEPAGDRYIYSSLLRAVPVTQAPAPPSINPGTGGAKWIDVNLTHQVVVAYEGSRAAYVAPTTSGRPGWQTPTGTFRIQRRVENETMVGSTLLRLDTLEVPDYRLENVKWTQYFTGNGAAIHTNYWRPVGLFGLPSSHGCLGMPEPHARWFWTWAGVGTPLVVHT
jgi:lipoprotein-anchoring transpeptidase ErfK/SrfK